MLTPNDVRAGDVVTTLDASLFEVCDNKKGIRRQTKHLATGDIGVSYVFDWELLHDGDKRRPITLPAKYREAADVIGRTIDVTCLPGPTPEPIKLGSLRHAWKGVITLHTVYDGKQTPVPAECDMSHQFPTDGTILFDGGRLTKRDAARLIRRRQTDRQTTLKSARDIWHANIDAATVPVYQSGSWEPSERNDGRPIQLFHSADKKLCVYLDASRFKLAYTVGKVQTWKAAGKAAGMVGYNKAGKATVVIMPVVLNR